MFDFVTYGVLQKYVANHNKSGAKTKVKMKKFLTALSSELIYGLFSTICFVWQNILICIFQSESTNYCIIHNTAVVLPVLQ